MTFNSGKKCDYTPIYWCCHVQIASRRDSFTNPDAYREAVTCWWSYKGNYVNKEVFKGVWVKAAVRFYRWMLQYCHFYLGDYSHLKWSRFMWPATYPVVHVGISHVLYYCELVLAWGKVFSLTSVLSLKLEMTSLVWGKLWVRFLPSMILLQQ